MTTARVGHVRVENPLSTQEVGRAVIVAQATEKHAGREPPPVYLVDCSTPATRDECRYMLREHQQWEWVRAGSAAWGLAFPAQLLPVAPDPLGANVGYRGPDTLPPASDPSVLTVDEPAAADPPPAHTLLFEGEVVGERGKDPPIDLNTALGDPIRVEQEGGAVGFPAWLGGFERDELGNAVPHVPTRAAAAARLLASRRPPIDEPTEVAAMLLAMEAGGWFRSMLYAYRTEPTRVRLRQVPAVLQLTPEGVVFTDGDTTVQCVRCRVGVTATAVIGHDRTFQEANYVGYSVNCTGDVIPVAVRVDRGSLLPGKSILAAVYKWALGPTPTGTGNPRPIPVIVPGNGYGVLVVVVDGKDAYVVRVLRNTDGSPHPEYCSRLVLENGMYPLIATYDGADALLVCRTEGPRYEFAVVRATMDVNVLFRRCRALDPVGRGPPVHAVNASCAFARQGSGQRHPVLFASINFGQYPREPGVPTLPAALRSFLDGMSDPNPGEDSGRVRVVLLEDAADPHPIGWWFHRVRQCVGARWCVDANGEPTQATAVAAPEDALVAINEWEGPVVVLCVAPASHYGWLVGQFAGLPNTRCIPVQECMYRKKWPVRFRSFTPPKPVVKSAGLVLRSYEGGAVYPLCVDDTVMGFVLSRSWHVPPIEPLGLTTDDLVAFLEATELPTPQCIVASRELVAVEDGPGLVDLISAFLASGTPVIVDVMNASPSAVLPSPLRRQPPVQYLLHDTMPATDANKRALAQVAGCKVAALGLLFGA